MIENIDIYEIITSASIGKYVDNSLDYINKRILGKSKEKYQLSLEKNADMYTSLLSHLNEIVIWSSQMEYQQSGRAIELSKLYVELDLYVEPVSFSGEKNNKKAKLKTTLKNLNSHLILLGRPGGGKTTTLKSICYDFIRGKSVLQGFFPIPIVLRLRELDNDESIFDSLFNIIGLKIKEGENSGSVSTNKLDYYLKQEIVINFLNENKILLIIDGFDEITGSNNNIKNKEIFVSEYRKLCVSLNNSLVILTSRTADFDFLIENTIQLELSKLSLKQVEKFLVKFFKNIEQRKEAEKALLNKKLLGSEFIPLTLTYLCIVFSKYGRLFNSRRETYNKLLDLLLEDWDMKRLVKRPTVFPLMDTHDKKRFLRQLSFSLTKKNKKSYFTDDQIISAYDKIYQDYEGLKKHDCKYLMQEIENHTGLFIKSGNGYIFSHLSLQEYLFATYLYEFPSIPSDEELLYNHPNELALAVSFNENPTFYFSFLIVERFNTSKFYEKNFISPFFDRIMLEETKFKIHPYLGLSFLVIYTRIKSSGESKLLSDRFKQKEIKDFYTFLNFDLKIDESLNLLKEYYSISSTNPEKNIIVLEKQKNINDLFSINEPSKIYASYDFYKYFA